MTLFLCAISFFTGAFFWSLIVVIFVASHMDEKRRNEREME